MRELRFSVRKLLKLAAGGILLSLGAIIIPLNRNIATGHVRGLWSSLLYEIGPTGRWAFALACVGFFLFAALRLTIVAAGDLTALRCGESGLYVRTIMKRRQMPWRDVLVIDTSTTTVRRRTRRSVRIRIREGEGEKSLLVPVSLLSADEDDVANWIAQARRMHTDSRTSKPRSSEMPPGLAFGRRRSSNAP